MTSRCPGPLSKWSDLSPATAPKPGLEYSKALAHGLIHPRLTVFDQHGPLQIGDEEYILHLFSGDEHAASDRADTVLVNGLGRQPQRPRLVGGTQVHQGAHSPAVGLVLISGFPAAFSLAGVSVMFAMAVRPVGAFDGASVEPLPNRLYGTMENESLITAALLALMGMTTPERSRLAEGLLDIITSLWESLCGTLGIPGTLSGSS